MNYRETPLTGQKWVRSNKVSISNPYNGIPAISFNEEEITVLSDGKTVNTPIGILGKTFDNPTGIFDLINPIDGSVIGSTSYQEVYVILHSLYISLAKARDLEAQNPPMQE